MSNLKENLKIINAATITGNSREENIYRELRNLIEEITDKYENPEKLSDEKIDMTATIKQYGYDAGEYEKMFGSLERSERDVVENLANLLVEKGYAKGDGKTPEPQKPAADDDKAKRLRLARAKAKAALALLELMKLDGIGGVTTAAPRKTAGVQGQLFDDVREQFDKHWDEERGTYVYTDFDGEEWYKNKQGHFCLLNGAKNSQTRKDYEEYLNELGEGLSEDEFIIGGKMRHLPYGTALRKYSPITFNAGYNEWKQEQGINGSDNENERDSKWIKFLKKEYPDPIYDEMIKEYVWGRSESDFNQSEDRFLLDFEGWLESDYSFFLELRFPEYRDECIEFASDNIGQENGWDESVYNYENLKRFKEWLDDRNNNYAEGGELFEINWKDDGEHGILTPLYTLADAWGDDYWFAEIWLKESLAADGLKLDRMWVNERGNTTYEFLAK